MGVLNHDLTDPRLYDYDPTKVEFVNGGVKLKLVSDLEASIVQTITPTETDGAGQGLDKINDGDPSTAYVDASAGPNSQVEWDFGGTTHVARVEFTLSKDARTWDKVVVEATPDADFTTTPANTVTIYASGDAAKLDAYVSGLMATDPNVAITTVTKTLTTYVRAQRIRITVEASDASPSLTRTITDFKVYEATHATSAQRIESLSPVSTKDLTLLTETATKPATTEIGYNVLFDGKAWWYDGTNWNPSDGGYAQSSTAADLTGTVLAKLLPQRVRTSVRLAFFLKTNAAEDTPTLEALALEFDDAPPMVNVPLTRVTGILRDGYGNPVVDATVTVSFVPKAGIKYTLNDVRVVDPGSMTLKTDANGHFAASVLPTDVMLPGGVDAAKWRFTINGEVIEGGVLSVEEIDIFTDGLV